jgi:hypothetical protein
MLITQIWGTLKNMQKGMWSDIKFSPPFVIIRYIMAFVGIRNYF